MSHVTTIQDGSAAQVSPMILSDRLIALAQAADRAGYIETAEHLVELACSVFDESPLHPLSVLWREQG